MKRKLVVLSLLAVGAVSLLAFNFFDAPKADRMPNIVLVYIDDMGFGDLGRTGAVDYTTPNFDDMASKGMFLSQYYTPQAVCTASRAGLLTGCYPNRLGFAGATDHSAKTGINADEETIAELLKAKGYATAAYGKWHLGFQKQFLPLQHGFDEYFGIPYSNDMWPNHPLNKNYYPPLPLIEGNETIATNPDQSQFTTWFTERTMGFIKKNKDKPFFVYLAHPMPHVPLFVSDKFKGKSKQGLYGDVIMELDWSIGQLRKTLKEQGLAENTLFIVTSDNGPWLTYGNHAGSSGGFREGKGTTFEGGHRVPFIAEWPGVIPAGVVSNNLSAGIDVLPTIVEATGAKLPVKRIDGVSLLANLKGDLSVKPRDAFYFYYRRNNLEAVRQGTWKLVFPHPGRTNEGFEPGNDGQPGRANENFNHPGGLYDLRRDPGERYNVMFDYPEVMAELTKTAEKARKDLGDDLTGHPGENRRPLGRVSQ
ncbi:sulfatase family protein [Persicitalea jodogahamensis]|uniref:Arylsulfatase n=1 Tax=Persicitalea jodogahamensis TaxID=402147 RepID=A0A8J3D5M0_9BACT|nr:sulfatase [Persicitalea jodogahamensis]GHB77710.1 arylsulfatase [Persicitalea jodogahamensis]